MSIDSFHPDPFALAVPDDGPDRTPQPALAPVLCSDCDAVCCRLTVVLMPEDRIPAWLVAEDDHGPDTMKKGHDGWCVALDRESRRCTIYADRPQICRKFSMGGEYCRDERDSWIAAHTRPGIPFHWR
jgi:uncharacterized protein